MGKELSLNPQQTEIFNQYLPEIPKVINSNFSSEFISLHMLDRSEMEQHAMIGLIKGIKTYSPDKKMKESTFYIQSMIWAITNGCRNDSLTSKTVRSFDVRDSVSIDNPLPFDSESTYQDVIIDTNDSYLIEGMTIDNKRLKQANKHLPFVIEALLQSKTHNEIAKKIGVSRSTVSRLIKQHEELIKESIVLADGTTL